MEKCGGGVGWGGVKWSKFAVWRTGVKTPREHMLNAGSSLAVNSRRTMQRSLERRKPTAVCR